MICATQTAGLYLPCRFLEFLRATMTTFSSRSPGMEFYNADTPDLIDIMLMEVVKFFGEKSGAD